MNKTSNQNKMGKEWNTSLGGYSLQYVSVCWVGMVIYFRVVQKVETYDRMRHCQKHAKTPFVGMSPSRHSGPVILHH